MAAQDITLIIERLDGEVLVLDGLALARAFFSSDRSSVGEQSYDALAGHGPRSRIRVEDIRTINKTMRARSQHARWQPLRNRHLHWLAQIDDDLDLIDTDDVAWEDASGERLSRVALARTIGPGRRAPSATKMLHLKRPKFFPILDDLVAQMLGLNPSENLDHEQRVDTAQALVLHIRAQGRAQIAKLRRIQNALADDGMDRPMVRILDAVLWFAHPATGVIDSPRRLTAQLR